VSFAQPLALFGLLLLPVIVLFYMWRAQHQRQVVSSTWLWAEALARFSHQPTRHLPLRDPLLLLQLLAVLTLTALFAGPRIAQPAHAHRIVVLDGSVAMAATDVSPSRFAVAKQRIQDMIAKLGADDTLSVILAGPHARLVGETGGDASLSQAIARLGAPSGVADLAGAVALARGLAAAPGEGAPRLTFIAAPETPSLPLAGLPVDVSRVGAVALDDQGIATLTTRCQPNGTSCQAFARVRNSAASTRTDDLEVLADGQSIGRQTLHLPARGSLDLAFAVPQNAHSLQVSLLGHDAVAADNSAWAIVPTPVHLRALFVSDAPGRLLRALRAVPGLTVQLVSSAKFQQSDFNSVDVLIMDGVAPDDIPQMPLLVIHPPASTSFVNVRATNVFLPADHIDVTDPLINGLDVFSLATNGEQIDIPSWARVVVGGKNGPLLMDGVQNGVRTAMITFDIAHSAFAQNLAFPLLVTRLVHWLTPSPPAAVSLGASVWLPPDVQGVYDPGGAFLPGPLVDASRQGAYTVAQATGSRVVGDAIFAVTTANPGDSTPDSAGISRWIPTVSGGTFAQALWPLAVLIALIALSGEWWFYAKRT
jgi:Ca-activated chloride channel family protein